LEQVGGRDKTRFEQIFSSITFYVKYKKVTSVINRIVIQN
jgi:hypothetical protein